MAEESEPQEPGKRLDKVMADRLGELDLKWKQLAGKVGISESALRKIRRGQNRGHPDTRYRLNKALQWEPGTLEAVFEGRMEPHEIPAAHPPERRPSDDDQPLTRGEFRLYVAVTQNPDTELSDADANQLRDLGVDLPRLREQGRDTR